MKVEAKLSSWRGRDEKEKSMWELGGMCSKYIVYLQETTLNK